MKAVRIVQFVFCIIVFYSCEEEARDESPLSATIEKNSASARIAQYTFTGQEGDPIALQTASKWTAAFREQNPKGIYAHFFGNEILKQILDEAGCVGIRMYHGVDDNGNRQLLIVGVDSNGDDLLPSSGGRIAEEDNTVGDVSYPCPTYCSSSGPL